MQYGPYPRNATRTAWDTQEFQDTLFSLLEGKDLISVMLLSRETFPKAVRAKWRNISHETAEKAQRDGDLRCLSADIVSDVG